MQSIAVALPERYKRCWCLVGRLWECVRHPGTYGQRLYIYWKSDLFIVPAMLIMVYGTYSWVTQELVALTLVAGLTEIVLFYCWIFVKDYTNSPDSNKIIRCLKVIRNMLAEFTIPSLLEDISKMAGIYFCGSMATTQGSILNEMSLIKFAGGMLLCKILVDVQFSCGALACFAVRRKLLH